MSLLATLFARNGLHLQHLGKGIALRQLRMAPAAKWLTTTTCMRSDATVKPSEDFWDKNKRLNRPMSPHLTIYKFQITSMLSITHRGTGLALSGLMSGFAIGMLMLPGSFPYYFGMLQTCSYGGALIFSTKFLLAWPFIFHFTNGIRHLAWDLGKGFENREVTITGWTVVGIATVLSIIAASM